MDTRGLLSHFFTFTHLRSPAAGYPSAVAVALLLRRTGVEQALITGLPIEAHNK